MAHMHYYYIRSIRHESQLIWDYITQHGYLTSHAVYMLNHMYLGVMLERHGLTTY